MPPDPEEIKRHYRGSLSNFVRFAHRELVPGRAPSESPHVRVLADIAEKVIFGEERRVIVNLPPRHFKSFVMSIAGPLYALGRTPSLRIMVVTGTRGLADELRETACKLAGRSRFRALFPNARTERTGSELRSAAGGVLSWSQFQSSRIGRGADIVIVDDPISAPHANDKKRREEVNMIFTAELVQRLDRNSAGRMIVAMQRLHPEDLTGYLIAQKSWLHVKMPAVAVHDEIWTLRDESVITRAKGEPLCPEVASKKDLKEKLREIHAVAFSAQYQQNTSIKYDRRLGHWHTPFPKTWDPERPYDPDNPGTSFIGYVSESAFLRRDLFDGPEIPYTTEEISPEYWRACLKFQQERLMKMVREDDFSGLQANKSRNPPINS